MVYFQTGVLFSIEKAKFWPILVILSQIYALLVFFGPGAVSKLINMRCGSCTIKYPVYKKSADIVFF